MLQEAPLSHLEMAPLSEMMPLHMAPLSVLEMAPFSEMASLEMAPLLWPVVPLPRTAVPHPRTCHLQNLRSSLGPSHTIALVSDDPY